MVAGALGIFAVSCSENNGPTPPVPSISPTTPPNFGVTDPANGPGACIGDDSNVFGETPGLAGPTDLNCTSNDIDIATATVKSYSFTGLPGSYVDLPAGQRISCLQGQTIFVETFANLQNNATSRWDIGFWLAASANNPVVQFGGGRSSNAVTGSCTHYNITNGSPGVSNLDNDACGDMSSGQLTSLKLDILTVQCSPDGNGDVSIGACVGWQNQVNGPERICPAPGTATTFRYGTTPDNKAKCNCEPLVLPIDLKGILRVKKTTVPAGDGTIFTFTPTNWNAGATFTRTDAQAAFPSELLSAGTYKVSETVPSGWDLTSRACVITGTATPANFTTAVAGEIVVNMAAGQDITCTFTNTKRGSIQIIKDAVPNDAQDFAFTTTGSGLSGFSLDDDADPTLSNTATFTNLVPGSFSVVEGTVGSWVLTDVACTGGGANTSASPATRTATIGLDAGESIVCTFTNTKQASITVAKTCVGGTGTFAFTGTVPGGGALGGFNRECGASAVAVASTTTFGAYTIAETALAGWALTDLVCTGGGANTSINTGTRTASIGLDAGENVTCTYTNTKAASITVAKTCVGGTGTFAYTSTIPGNAAFNRDCGVSAQVGGAITTFGSYTVTESSLAGWALTDLQCTGGGANTSINTGTATATIGIDAGESVTCTFTNTKQASITVAKTCVGAASGTFAFTGTVPGGGALGGFNRDCGTSSVAVAATTTFGAYTIAETAQAGWVLSDLSCSGGGANTTFSTATRTASIGLDAGESVTCTYTNTKLGTINIVKQTDPNGSSGNFSFSHTVGTNSNPTVATPFLLADGATQSFTNVVPGSYTVTEAVLAGFDLVASGDGFTTACTDATTNSTISLATRAASIALGAGETVTCTFVNRKRATVQVIKNENGTLPLSIPFAFQIRQNATTLLAGTVIASGTADPTTGVVTFACVAGDPPCVNVAGVANIVPGAYQFCEVNMLPGWANNIAGFTPSGSQPEGADNGDECINITLAAGASGQPSGITVGNVNINNTRPPGGDARTIGYWKNHSCEAPGKQADVLTTKLPITLATGAASPPDAGAGDDLIISAAQCHLAVAILDKRSFNNGKKMASDGAYNLASQLTATLLNVNSGATQCTAQTDAMIAGQRLLDEINFTGSGAYLKSGDAKYALAVSLAGTLDKYNNNLLCP